MKIFTKIWIVLPLALPVSLAHPSNPNSPITTDYCDLLGQDDIQNKKSGFLAGNKVYYVGGKYLIQRCAENETIGLSHPMFHDLRSRGTGIATYDGVGTGNDFDGWEFHRATEVAVGSVVTANYTWVRPAPTRMFWRPDKMIVEYNLTNPFLQGVYDGGWCANWTQVPYPPGTNSSSFWVNLTEQACWAHCDADSNCVQAVYESNGDGQCWTGTNLMTTRPTSSRGAGCSPGPCIDKCYAKGKVVENVTIREEKFVSENDVISTIMTSDKPVSIEISGRSFAATGGSGTLTSLNPSCTVDHASNAIHVVEGGRVAAHVQNDASGQPVYEEGKLMYDGMSTVLSSSRPLENATTFPVDTSKLGNIDKVCGYRFRLALPGGGDNPTTLSWTMADDYTAALGAVTEVLEDPGAQLQAKTAKMNGLLNEVVPYFRCSDPSIVKVYYFLWSIYLMYFTRGTEGMQRMHPHTQSAVNNFLGMHRFDAVFQIIVGSWTNPARHDFYANGNALVWSELLPYRKGATVPDNFGTTWASGCYGDELVGHVIGACQIFEHNQNMTFLTMAYDFYKTMFWDDGLGGLFGYGFESALCLNKMATILGHANDTAHWSAAGNLDGMLDHLKTQWEIDTPNFYGSTKGGMAWINVATSGLSVFPRDWVVAMAENWLDNPQGFFGKVPLTRTAVKDWAANPPGVFTVVPDANFYSIRPLFLHSVNALANKFTLAHLKKYNMEWGGIPVAPEARKQDFSLFGDQYSNFNAGKLLLIIEGLGGLNYSAHDDVLTFADSLPQEWTFLELRIPVQKSVGSPISWVKVRSERACVAGKVVKTVTVNGNPFRTLNVRPWTEDARVTTFSPAGAVLNGTHVGHAEWTMANTKDVKAAISLDEAC